MPLPGSISGAATHTTWQLLLRVHKCQNTVKLYVHVDRSFTHELDVNDQDKIKHILSLILAAQFTKFAVSHSFNRVDERQR